MITFSINTRLFKKGGRKMKKMCLLLALLLALGALDGIAEENSPFTTRSTGSIDGYSGPGGAWDLAEEKGF